MHAITDAADEIEARVRSNTCFLWRWYIAAEDRVVYRT